MADMTTDWSKCDAVEKVPDRMGGVLVFKNTRLAVSQLFGVLRDGGPSRTSWNGSIPSWTRVTSRPCWIIWRPTWFGNGTEPRLSAWLRISHHTSTRANLSPPVACCLTKHEDSL